MVEVGLILNISQTVAILVGVILALMELRHVRQTRDMELETRQAQLFMQLYDRFSQAEFAEDVHNMYLNWKWTDPDDFFKKYGPEVNSEVFSRLIALGNFFRGVGVLLNRGLIDRRLVDDLLHSPVVMYWEKMEPVAKEYRVRYKLPRALEFIDHLYSELKKEETR